MREIVACALIAACLGCGQNVGANAANAEEDSPAGAAKDITLEAVEKAFSEGRRKEAKAMLDRLIAADPSHEALVMKAQILVMEAGTLLQKQPEEAIRKYEEGLAVYKRVQDKDGPLKDFEKFHWSATQYGLACAFALSGKPEKAIAMLKKAHDAGFDNLDYYEQDDDLKAVRELPEFAAFLKQATEARIRLVQEKLKAFKPVNVDFEVKDVTGKTVKLADLQGKVVMLDCWATWCGPCLMMLPTMKSMHAKYKEDGLVILGLNFEGDEEEAATKAVQDFLKEKPLPYRCAAVGKDVADKLPEFEGLPTWFFIDRAGRIRYQATGAQPTVELETAIQTLLKEPAK